MSSPHVVSKPDKLVDSLLEKIHEQQQMILILEGELQALHQQLLVTRGGMEA
jgi:hypothetical protein